MSHCSLFVSDTHFGHANIIQFKGDDGKAIRPFATIEEHDELMVENWNRVVRPQDRVYHLGDVVMNRRCLPIMERLNGKKVLIKGNHDIFPLKDYVKYFEDIRAYKVFPNHGIICSHIPVHPREVSGRWKLNVHGHLHQNIVETRVFEMPYNVPDTRYMNICVEHTNYTPVTLEEITARISAIVAPHTESA